METNPLFAILVENDLPALQEMTQRMSQSNEIRNLMKMTGFEEMEKAAELCQVSVTDLRDIIFLRLPSDVFRIAHVLQTLRAEWESQKKRAREAAMIRSSCIRLREKLIEIGYQENAGYPEPIAVLGMAGEAGEVLEAWLEQVDEGKTFRSKDDVAMLRQFIEWAKIIDGLKKAIRDKKKEVTRDGIEYESEHPDWTAFMSEVYDQRYYSEIVLMNMGKRPGDSCEASLEKVIDRQKKAEQKNNGA